MNPALETLRLRFVARCGEDRAAIAEAAAGGDAERLKHLSHKLAGAAGTFGYEALSAAAREVEDQLDLGQAPDAASLRRLDERLAETAASA